MMIKDILCALVIFTCYNKYHRLCVLNDRHLFLIVLEAKKSKIKVLTKLVLSGGSSWLANVSLHSGEKSEHWSLLLIRSLIPS